MSPLPRLVALRLDDYPAWASEALAILRLNLTYPRAARLLGVSLRTTQRWAKELACQPGQGRRGGKGSEGRNRQAEAGMAEILNRSSDVGMSPEIAPILGFQASFRSEAEMEADAGGLRDGLSGGPLAPSKSFREDSGSKRKLEPEDWRSIGHGT